MKPGKDIKLSVIGGGSWGTALAKHLAQKGYTVHFWVMEDEVCESIKANGINSLYLPEVTLPDNILPTTNLASALSGKDLLVFSVPTQFIRDVLTEGKKHISRESLLVNTSKGIELSTNKLVAGIFADILADTYSKDVLSKLVILSGPSFALEVAQMKPTAVSLASSNANAAAYAQEVFSSPYFRPYVSADVIGVEIGGAMKNVIAIAAGIVEGLGVGSNAKAALITRGLAEITRLGVKMGADQRTFSGLAGMGDLVLTCTGGLSRNRKVGIRIAEGETLESIVSGMRMVAEGIKTSRAALELAKKYDVDMPITEKVVDVLYEGKSPDKAIYELMTRELKTEIY